MLGENLPRRGVELLADSHTTTDNCIVKSQCPVSNNSFGSIWFSMVLVGHGFINCLPSESFVVSFS